MSKAAKHLANIGTHDTWETPQNLYEEACRKFKIYPKLDVCANGKNTKCPVFITKEDDSLEPNVKWDKDFFCNPPYSKVREFLEKASIQSVQNNVNGLILVYAKTDTKWWHDFVEHKTECHFIKGRIKFLDEQRQPSKNSAPYGSVWVIFRRHL